MTYFKSGAIRHSGSDWGVSTIMLFNSKTNSGKIFMSNEDLTEKNLDKFKDIWKSID